MKFFSPAVLKKKKMLNQALGIGEGSLKCDL